MFMVFALRFVLLKSVAWCCFLHANSMFLIKLCVCKIGSNVKHEHSKCKTQLGQTKRIVGFRFPTKLLKMFSTVIIAKISLFFRNMVSVVLNLNLCVCIYLF